MCTCYITIPTKQIQEIEFDPKQIGKVILDKVLNNLNTIEVDFFGLQYYGPKREELWLNLRNRFCDQISESSHQVYSLKLKVKFFVQPQFVQQETTKELIYEQAKEAISQRLISLAEPHCDEGKLARLVAYVTQVDHGDLTSNSYQRNTYEDVLSKLYPGFIPPQPLIDLVHMEHSNLVGVSPTSARYFMLQICSELPGYGVETHKVTTAHGVDLNFGVGPDGLALQNIRTKEERSISYLQISLATHDDKAVHIHLMDDACEIQAEECYKLVSRRAAVALYRCITEMHSFYRCDTVNEDVQTQYCRDFKGTFVSIFNDNSKIGKRFVFDIQRTSKEAYDAVRRKLFKSMSPGSSPAHSLRSTVSQAEEGDDGLEEEFDGEAEGAAGSSEGNKEMHRENKCLKRRLEALEDSLLCCICMYQKVCVVLCPCGHMTCDMCSDKISLCPLCRVTVDRFQKVFQGFGNANANKVCENRVLHASGEDA